MLRRKCSSPCTVLHCQYRKAMHGQQYGLAVKISWRASHGAPGGLRLAST